jgi:hypothetical protein
MVKKILARHPNSNLRDNDRKTALMLAKEMKQYASISAIERYSSSLSVVSKVENKVDGDAKTLEDLIDGSSDGDLDLVILCVEKYGVEVNCRDGTKV